MEQIGNRTPPSARKMPGFIPDKLKEHRTAWCCMLVSKTKAFIETNKGDVIAELTSITKGSVEYSLIIIDNFYTVPMYLEYIHYFNFSINAKEIGQVKAIAIFLKKHYRFEK